MTTGRLIMAGRERTCVHGNLQAIEQNKNFVQYREGETRISRYFDTAVSKNPMIMDSI